MKGPILGAGRNIYPLLDDKRETPVRKALYGLEGNPQWQPLFEETEWSVYSAESPLFIRTDNPSKFLDWTLDSLSSDQVNGLILESDADFETVLGWARQRLTVGLGGVRRGLLRFYDPRVWHQLAPRDIGKACCIQRVHYWQVSGVDGRWAVSHNPEPVDLGRATSLEPEQVRAPTAKQA